MPKNAKNFWGKHFWFVIHYAALLLAYEDFKRFLLLLTKLLPCSECRTHLLENIKVIFPETVPRGKKIDTFLLSIDLHHLVNRQLGKIFKASPERIKAYYINKGSVNFDKEFLFTIRAIAFTGAYDDKYFKEYLSMLLPFTSTYFQKSYENLPFREEYQSQDDAFSWSIRLGGVFLARKGFTQDDRALKESFSESMTDDCSQCSLR